MKSIPRGFRVKTVGPRTQATKKKASKTERKKMWAQRICTALDISRHTPTGAVIYDQLKANQMMMTYSELRGLALVHPDLKTAKNEYKEVNEKANILQGNVINQRSMNRNRHNDSLKRTEKPLVKRQSLTAAQVGEYRKWCERNAHKIANQDTNTLIGMFHRDRSEFLAADVKQNVKNVKSESEAVLNPLPQNENYTLQLIRMPSDTVSDLGRVSYENWLLQNHYDTTNLGSQHSEWVYSDGWHIKRCVNTVTGEHDFWLIAFNGRGGEPIGIKSQRDYMSAYRYLIVRGYHSTALENMERGALYRAYKHELAKKTSERETIQPKKPIRNTSMRTPEQVEERRQQANRLKALRQVAVREGQGRFRLQVLANYHGACCITGLVDGVEAAHIVPHRETANQHPNNGLPLIKALHAAFDSGFFSINPATLRVVVREDARGWLNIDGKQIDDGGIWQIDRIALAKHYEAFMKAQSQSGIGNSQSNN